MEPELKRFESYDMTHVNESSLLYGEQIKELKAKDKKSLCLFVSKMGPGPVRDYMDKWLFDTYYEKKIPRGNLTKILKTSINNKVSYREIMRRCFDSVDILHSKRTIKDILTKDAMEVIQEIHSINSSICGSFLDYLVRRTISELRNIPFEDSRADHITNPYHSYTEFEQYRGYENVKISDEDFDTWEFVPNGEYGLWTIRDKPTFFTDKIGTMEAGDKFVVLEKQDIWLKIFYKNKIGYVRHRIPNCNEFHEQDIGRHEIVDNIYLRPFEKNFHYCQFGCKYRIEQVCFGEEENRKDRFCQIPSCQNLAYSLAKHTETYATENILPDIFICSLCHTEAFGRKPKQEEVLKIYKLLSNEAVVKKLYPAIKDLCEELLDQKTNILLNPGLGCNGIPADADLILDDTLYDIKCTKSKTKDSDDVYEIEQLLGYVSLYTSEEEQLKIKKISILNLLEGKQKEFHIDYITKEQLARYLRLLSRR